MGIFYTMATLVITRGFIIFPRSARFQGDPDAVRPNWRPFCWAFGWWMWGYQHVRNHHNQFFKGGHFGFWMFWRLLCCTEDAAVLTIPSNQPEAAQVHGLKILKLQRPTSNSLLLFYLFQGVIRLMTSLQDTRQGYSLICFGAAQLGKVCAVRGGLQLIDPLPKDTSCSRTSHRGETLLVLWEEHGGAIHHYQPGILSMQKGSKFHWWTKGCSCRFCKHDLALRPGPSVPARTLLNTFVRSKHSCPIGLKQVNTGLVAGTMENWTGDLAHVQFAYMMDEQHW